MSAARAAELRRRRSRRGTVEIWYAVVGKARSACPSGAAASSDLLGPGGHGWRVPEVPAACSWSAAASAFPVLCLARELAEAGVAVDACVGSATAAKLVGVEDFEALGAGEVCVATDDGTAGLHGFCTESAAELLSSHEYDYVATCGPGVMMSKVAASAAEAGVYCEASLERMMSCGFGACSTCNVETTDGMQGACMCGPVFDATKVVVW
ncbi:MAG: dihydroorotate dehydrogenase electron transfer subunit [Collinsella intestinalis]